MLVRSSRARSIDRNTDRRGRDTILGKDVSLGRHQTTGMSSPLARRRFNRAGGGRTRAGRQEMSAAPVFPNFEVFRIHTPDTIILIKLTCHYQKVESMRERLGGKVTKLK